MVKYTLCEWLSGTSVFDVKFDKIRFWWLFWGKIINFGIDAHTSDAKTDPFIPVGADLFVYLKHTDIQIIEITGKDCKLCLTFGQSTGLKKPVCEPNPLYYI